MHKLGLTDIAQFGDSTGDVLARRHQAQQPIERRLSAVTLIRRSVARLVLASACCAAGARVPHCRWPARVAIARVADAAMRGDVAAVRTLLQQGADVNAPQGDGMTALHWAAEQRRPGAGGDCCSTRGAQTGGGDAHRPLHAAARRRQGRPCAPSCGCSSTRSADVNAMTTTGAAPLHFAAASGSAEAIALLLDAGADVNAREPQWGQTPLMFAAAVGRTDAVQGAARRAAPTSRPPRSVVDISARNREDSAESRERNARIAAIQKRARRGHGRGVSERRRRRPPRRVRHAAPRAPTMADEPEPLGYADLVGAHGGLTALLLAAREGLDETVVRAARRRRRHQPGERGRSHEPAADGDDQRPLRSRDAAAGARRRRDDRRATPARRRSTACSTCSGRRRRGIRSRPTTCSRRSATSSSPRRCSKAGADPNARLTQVAVVHHLQPRSARRRSHRRDAVLAAPPTRSTCRR